MAPRAKAQAAAGASDSEDDLAATLVKGAGNKRTTTKMPPKSKAIARRASVGRTVAKRKAAPKQSRPALKDRTNLQDGNDTEEVNEFDEEQEMAKPKAKKPKTTATRKTAAAKKADDDKKPKRGRAAKRAQSPEQPVLTIPETQPDPEQIEDVEQSIEVDSDNMDIEKEPTPKQVQRYVQRAPSASIQQLQPRPSARAGSAQPLQPRPSARAGSAQPGFAPIRERSGSVSGTERRGGDPELRRQLNDISTRYENLQMKYESLQEIGKDSAESNFEKLKRASDQKAKDANDLIASLKKELAELQKSSTTVSSETTSLQKQVTTLTATNEKITKERDNLKEKLHVSQNEVKSLEVKLTAARQQIANSAQDAKAQEAAAAKKHNSAIPVNGADAQKDAKMKENLYADLCGLIILNVKRKEGEDVYDCVQTGRNGSLHFHLSIGSDAKTPHPKTPSGLSGEEAEFAYEPLLDESRDKELLDILPDYLTEEICFPRNHAQRFYGKVVESMTKNIVVEEDDE